MDFWLCIKLVITVAERVKKAYDDDRVIVVEAGSFCMTTSPWSGRRRQPNVELWRPIVRRLKWSMGQRVVKAKRRVKDTEDSRTDKHEAMEAAVEADTAKKGI